MTEVQYNSEDTLLEIQNAWAETGRNRLIMIRNCIRHAIRPNHEALSGYRDGAMILYNRSRDVRREGLGTIPVSGDENSLINASPFMSRFEVFNNNTDDVIFDFLDEDGETVFRPRPL